MMIAYVIVAFASVFIYLVTPGFVTTILVAFIGYKLVRPIRKGIKDIRYLRQCKKDQEKARETTLFIVTDSMSVLNNK